MWKKNVYRELQSLHLFENSEHQSRFKELLDCYSHADFFTPGLCKCMYLSCWDDEHFGIMLEMLNQLSLKNDMTLSDMNENGELMTEEMSTEGYEIMVMKLSCAFLTDGPFDIRQLPPDFDPVGRETVKVFL